MTVLENITLLDLFLAVLVQLLIGFRTGWYRYMQTKAIPPMSACTVLFVEGVNNAIVVWLFLQLGILSGGKHPPSSDDTTNKSDDGKGNSCATGGMKAIEEDDMHPKNSTTAKEKHEVVVVAKTLSTNRTKSAPASRTKSDFDGPKCDDELLHSADEEMIYPGLKLRFLLKSVPWIISAGVFGSAGSTVFEALAAGVLPIYYVQSFLLLTPFLVVPFSRFLLGTTGAVPPCYWPCAILTACGTGLCLWGNWLTAHFHGFGEIQYPEAITTSSNLGNEEGNNGSAFAKSTKTKEQRIIVASAGASNTNTRSNNITDGYSAHFFMGILFCVLLVTIRMFAIVTMGLQKTAGIKYSGAEFSLASFGGAIVINFFVSIVHASTFKMEEEEGVFQSWYAKDISLFFQWPTDVQFFFIFGFFCDIFMVIYAIHFLAKCGSPMLWVSLYPIREVSIMTFTYFIMGEPLRNYFEVVGYVTIVIVSIVYVQIQVRAMKTQEKMVEELKDEVRRQTLQRETIISRGGEISDVDCQSHKTSVATMLEATQSLLSMRSDMEMKSMR